MSKKLTQEEFLAKAVAVHGVGRYDYSQTIYKLTKNKVRIICPVHGEFEQVGSEHLFGKGCAQCGRAKRDLSHSREREFIERARAAHGELYDYSLVNYPQAKNKVRIICPVHGEFEQLVDAHLNGRGCRKCGRIITALKLKGSKPNGASKTWIEKAEGRNAHLYFLKIFNESEAFYKVGITYKSVALRYSGGKGFSFYNYELLAIHTSNNAASIYSWEQSIIETFAHLRYRPKHHFNGETECFSSADEILAIFPL